MENTKSISFADKQLLDYLFKQTKKESLQSSLLLSIEETMMMLRTNKHAVNMFIKLGYIKAIKTNKGTKISKDSVKEFSKKLFSNEFHKYFGQEISDFYQPIKDKLNV